MLLRTCTKSSDTSTKRSIRRLAFVSFLAYPVHLIHLYLPYVNYKEGIYDKTKCKIVVQIWVVSVGRLGSLYFILHGTKLSFWTVLSIYTEINIKTKCKIVVQIWVVSVGRLGSLYFILH